MQLVQDMILRADQRRLLPKRVEGVTGEIGLEDKARRHGAGGEHRERDQHDDRQFMRRVAVIVVRVIVVAVSRARVFVVTMRCAVIGALAKEGHEH